MVDNNDLVLGELQRVALPRERKQPGGGALNELRERLLQNVSLELVAAEIGREVVV